MATKMSDTVCSAIRLDQAMRNYLIQPLDDATFVLTIASSTGRCFLYSLELIADGEDCFQGLLSPLDHSLQNLNAYPQNWPAFIQKIKLSPLVCFWPKVIRHLILPPP